MTINEYQVIPIDNRLMELTKTKDTDIIRYSLERILGINYNSTKDTIDIEIKIKQHYIQLTAKNSLGTEQLIELMDYFNNISTKDKNGDKVYLKYLTRVDNYIRIDLKYFFYNNI